MATTLATGQITIIDLNDAIISGTAPLNPSVGTLWLKEIEDGPDELYSWNGTEWVLQQISLGGLDPDANEKIETAIDKLTNISKDNIITVSERLEVLNQVMLIVGKTLTETADMPTITDIDVTIRKGEMYSVRREAANAGVATSHTAYVAVETAYNNLRAYLNPMSPKPWNVTLDSNITVVPDTWRTKWLDYYNAVASLREIVAAKQKENTDNAHTKIDDMANDNKLTANEKQDAKKEWDIIQSEKTMIEQQATTFGITTEKENYLLAFNNLSTYITPLLSNLTVTSTIDGPTFRSNFKDYYDKKTTVLKKISDLTYSKFDDLANDNKLTPSEKKTVQREWEMIQTEKPILETQGSALAITTELNTYITSFNSLKDYLLPLLTVLTVESAINGVEFRTKFTNYNTAKTNLLKKINDIAHDQLEDIASDDKVTPNEKYALKKEWDTIKDEKPGLDVQAVGLKISTELTAYRNSYTALEEYVTPLFNVMTSTSDVDGQLLRTKFTDYYAARNNLVRVINDLKVDLDDFNGNNIVTLLNDPATTFKIRMKQLDIEGGITISELSQEAKDMITNGNQDLINSNASFFDWTGTYPNGYTAAAGAAPTKVSSDNGSGFAARYVSPASNQYMSQVVANKPFYQYVYVEITFKLESGTLDAAGVLFRYLKADGSTTLYDLQIKLKDLVPSVQLNKWYTVSKVSKVNVSSDFSKYQIFTMPNFSSLGTLTAKTIQFGSVKTRSATEQEVKAYEAIATLTSKASTWDAKETTTGAQAKANQAEANAKNLIPGSIIKNPLFIDWSGTTPAGTALWSTTPSSIVKKETTLTRSSSNAVRITPAGTEDAGLQLNGSFYIPNVSNSKYLVVEVDFLLVSGSLNGAGILVDWTGMTPYRVSLPLNAEVSSPQLNKWYTVRKIIVRPSDVVTGWSGMSGFLMANYDSLGSKIAKDIVYDRLHIREATAEEIKAYESDIMIANMSSDSKVTPIEKVQLKKEWATIVAEKPQYESIATTYGVTTEKTNYVNAYNALNTTVTSVLSDMKTTSDIDGATFRNTFDDYYDKKAQLTRKINELSRTLANNAQTTATNALNGVNDMTSDMKITPLEKSALKTTWEQIKAEYSQLSAQATALSVSSSTYVTAYNALNGTTPKIEAEILASMNTTYTFASTTTRDTFRTQMTTYFNEAEKLRKAIADNINALAGTANTAAGNAQQSANTANQAIADMSSDSKITPVEKVQLKKEWAAISAEKPQYEALATVYGVDTEKTNFVNAYNALNTTVTSVLSSMTTTTTVDGATFRNTFDDYYDKKAQLLKKINEVSRTIGTDAQTSANTANQAISDMSSDSKITPVEKVQLKKEWAVIVAEKPQFESVATTYGITTEKTNYVNAYNALNTSITSILSNMTTTTDVNGATFRNTFDDYYGTKAILVKKINELSRSIGTGAQSTANTANDKITLSLDANNLNPNPSFEGKKNTFYTAATAFAATDTGVPAGAPKSFVGRQTGRDNYISDFFSVKAGDKFLVEGWIASTDSAQSFGLGLNTQMNDGTNNWLVSGHKPKGDGTWQYFSNIYTVTANHTKARFFSQINASASFGNWFFTDVRVTKILNDDIIASAGNWNGTKTMVDDMSKDSKVTPVEKVQLKKEWAAISAEKPQFESLATTYGVGTEKTNYVNAFNALNTTVTSILSNMSVTSDVNGATFRSTFDDYYDKKAQLVKKINELSREIATGAKETADTVNGIVTTNKSDWDDAKKKIDLWKYSGDQLKINGGVIALKTIFAQQIALADFTNLCQINEVANPLGYTIVTVANDKHFRIGTGAYATIQFADSPQVEFKVNDEYYYSFIGYKEAAVTNVNFIIRYHYTDGTWTNAGSSIVPIQTSGGFVEGTVKVTVAPTSGKTIKRVQYFMEKDSGTSGYYYLRNLELRKRNGAELIVDGAIRGRHILADEVDTQHLKANIVKAKHLDVNSITWSDVARGGQLILGGVNNVNGELVVYGQDEEDIRVQLNTLMEDGTYSSGFQKLNAQQLYASESVSAPNIVTKTISSVSLYVDPINGDDENNGASWGLPLATLQEAINRLPKFLAHDVEIQIHYNNGTEMYENVLVEGFTGPGNLLINFQNGTNTLYGDITFSYVNCSVKMNRGRVISTRDAAPVYVLGCSGFTAQGVFVDANKKTAYGFYISNARGDLRDCETYNANTAAIIAAYGSQVDAVNCKGSASVALRSHRASVLSVIGTYPAGSWSEYEGGIIRGTPPKDPIPVPTTPTTPPVTTYKTVTVTSTSQKSWRPGFGGQWYRNEVCQGLYSSAYGRYKGFWFFGTQFDQFNGKTITKIRIYTKRYSGGGTAASQTARFILHNYASQPSSTSSPAIYGGDSTATAATSGFEWGEAKWVDVTNAFKSHINRTDVKGIGLWVYANSPYMLFSGSLKVEVTYKV